MGKGESLIIILVRAGLSIGWYTNALVHSSTRVL